MLFFHLFDVHVQPAFSYASEIWRGGGGGGERVTESCARKCFQLASKR